MDSGEGSYCRQWQVRAVGQNIKGRQVRHARNCLPVKSSQLESSQSQRKWCRIGFQVHVPEGSASEFGDWALFYASSPGFIWRGN